MSRPIVHLCNAPTPYRIAESDTAVRALGKESLTLIFADDFYHTACWSKLFPRECPYYTLGGTPEQNGVGVNELPALLERLDPLMVILAGYRDKPYEIGAKWCRQHGVPYCMRSASNYWSDKATGLHKFIVRRALLGRFVRHADLCLVTGMSNRWYWQRYGMRPEQEGWFPQYINYPLYSQARHMRRTQRDELRKKFGIRPEIAVFTAGRILPLKRVDLMCEAMLRLDERIGLVVAGHGVAEAELRQKYAAKLGDRLVFLGDIEPDQLHECYAATDIYCLASGSREQWGHVVTESLTGGMPIVIHRLTGAAPDLVHNGVNGFVLDSFDPDAWAAAFRRFVDDPSLLASMGEASTRIVDVWQARSNPAECLRRLRARYER
ncbi:MAG: glycosyltransferase family 4 protein [Pirellulales bacterium]|nr:glycosyltransferase family 4 protein [Pirellulales bacterium]